MTFRRFAVSLAAVCALLACADQAAIVALNVTADADVPVVAELHVAIMQGSHKFVYDFTPPIQAGDGDAGPTIAHSFFERITLPLDFDDQDARIFVEALQAGAVPFTPPLTSETTVRIEADGAVAAYVTLSFPPPPPDPNGDAGAGGEGGG